MILESVEHGQLIWPTIEENGVTRTKKYEELSATKKFQADYDLKATNIILQGLPSDEELRFLADPGVTEGPTTQKIITYNAAYQADDLDAYYFDCDDFSTAQAVLMANLSSYGSDVLSELVHSLTIDSQLQLGVRIVRIGVDIVVFKKLSYARAMIEHRADVELNGNIVAIMPKITREGYYNCNICVEYEGKTSQSPKGISVRQKITFKLKQDFQPVSKKSTANTCGKKKNLKSTKEVSMSNPFEVLTSVDNDMDLGKLRFVDDDMNPLVSTGIVDNDSEVEVRDSYPDNDNYDPYDDDMYENHDTSKHLQSICDDLDSTKTGCPEETMTNWHTMPEEPALNHTETSLDDTHVSDVLDQQNPLVD
nr:hypothetical protein [Tanacetum cinerariifolium]